MSGCTRFSQSVGLCERDVLGASGVETIKEFLGEACTERSGTTHGVTEGGKIILIYEGMSS